MTDRVVDREVAEVSSKPAPGAALPVFQGEVLSRASFGAGAVILQEQQAWQCALFERNPNGNVQWTEAAFNAAEFGVESA